MAKSLERARDLFIKVYQEDSNDLNVINRFLDSLSELSEREEAVLLTRYGIEDGQPKSAKEVSLIYEVSESTIRRVESMAIKKLRHPTRYNKIKVKK